MHQLEVGEGAQNHFWMDEWIGKGSLKDQFPRIFAIAQFKNMVVEEAYIEGNGSRSGM